MKRIIIISLAAASLLAVLQSCAKKPLACFNTIPPIDSIRVNMPVTFSAGCSNDAHDYNWEFYGNPDSVEFGVSFVKTFKDTGNVQVYLFVINGGQSNSYQTTLHVNP